MKNFLDTLKSIFDLLKQFLILGIIVCLFVYPEAIGRTLDRMGLVEGDLWGFKWKKQLLESDAAVASLNSQVVDLSSLLKQSTNAIAGPQSMTTTNGTATSSTTHPSPAAIQADEELVKTNAAAIKAADQAVAAAESTFTANTALIGDESASSQWGIVAGGDPTESAAGDELKRAISAGYSQAKLYHRLNSYRTVISFDTRQEAGRSLSDVRTKMRRPEAYVVDLGRWCVGGQPSGENIIECGVAN